MFTELLHRGYGADDVAKIAGCNLLRVMYEVDAAGERIDNVRDPSEARIEDRDGPG